MSDPFLGEIKVVSFNYAPKGWAMCNGQLLPINQNQALFSILGTTYGGNGQTTFALPDMRGRMPMHMGNGHTLGERAGEEAHTLTIAETPAHNHLVTASLASAAIGAGHTVTAQPSGNMLSRATKKVYSSSGPNTTLSPETITNAGGSQPHVNMQPFLALTFIIALQGIFPSQN